MTHKFKTDNDVAVQYNFLEPGGMVNSLKGIILNPHDFEHLDKIQMIHRSANKDDTSGSKILGHPVSSCAAVPPGHVIWLGVDFKVLAYTNNDGNAEDG